MMVVMKRDAMLFKLLFSSGFFQHDFQHLTFHALRKPMEIMCQNMQLDQLWCAMTVLWLAIRNTVSTKFTKNLH